jgi:hypothetical protein
MPILPANRARYPANWNREVRPAILRRAHNRCERCGLLNGVIGYRDPDGTFHFLARSGFLVKYIQSLHPDKHVFKLVVTIAHLDHTPENNDPANLAALCQRCHLRHDAQHHAGTARATRRSRLAIRDLFDEEG